jgi:translation initiation factor IF-3
VNNTKDTKGARQPLVQPKEHIINEQIRARELRLIGSNGDNVGVVSLNQARSQAEGEGLDLVIISKPDILPPVAKIMDYGKFLYEKKKKDHESKKKQKIIQEKEIKMRPNIGAQDYKTKLKQAVEFLREGKRVKFTLQFRGREVIMMNKLGVEFFERISADLAQANLGVLLEEKETRGKPFWSKIIYLK